MDNLKDGSKNTKIRRTSPKNRRSTPIDERKKIDLVEYSALRSKNFTAHHFKEYRIKRGLLIRNMRLRRGIPQTALGAPSQIRLYESGKAAQIGTQEILARLVPCPREMLKLWQIDLEHLPVACVACRKDCTYKGLNEESMLAEYMADITNLEFD